MSGYSGTPLPKKLGIKPGHRVLTVRAPQDFAGTLGPLPEGVKLLKADRGGAPFDVIVCFVRAKKELLARIDPLRARMVPNAGLWFAWPKKSSGVPCDMTEGDVRSVGLAARLVDNKVCAIDETWSGLRLVIRVKDR